MSPEQIEELINTVGSEVIDFLNYDEEKEQLAKVYDGK